MVLEASTPRSRRAILAAAVGGLGALMGSALGRPQVAQAAAGDTLKLGQANDSGTSQTILSNAGLGAAFTLKTTNLATGATGIFGWSSQTGAHATRGALGQANGANSFGVEGKSTGVHGSGAAIHAVGGQNDGVQASSSNPNSAAVRGMHDGVGAASGDGVYGWSAAATGIHGDSTDGLGVGGGSTNGYGVYGDSDNGIGVRGNSANGIGVIGTASVNVGVGGTSVTGYGVSGSSDSNDGVAGHSSTGSGVSGDSTDGTGVSATSGNAPGMTAYSENSYGIAATSLNSHAGLFNGSVRIQKFLDLQEIADPASPSSDTARLFVRDNGDGDLTQLCVKFSDGEIKVIVTESP
jgi:hypothetical protein